MNCSIKQQFENLFISVNKGINSNGTQLYDYKTALNYYKKKEPYNLCLIYRLIACLVIIHSMKSNETPYNIEHYYNDIKFLNGFNDKYSIDNIDDENYKQLCGILNKEINQFKYIDDKNITYFLVF